MKLKTADILPTVISLALTHVSEIWGKEDLAPMCLAAGTTKLWKRYEKMELLTCFKNWEGEDPEDIDLEEWMSEDQGFEFEDRIQNTPITWDCIARHFVNLELEDGLDAWVITDSTDSVILRVYWHSD